MFLGITCDVLTHPPNGSVSLQVPSKYQSEAFYICDDGYKLDGVSKRTCLKDGSWSNEEPVCLLS